MNCSVLLSTFGYHRNHYIIVVKNIFGAQAKLQIKKRAHLSYYETKETLMSYR